VEHTLEEGAHQERQGLVGTCSGLHAHVRARGAIDAPCRTATCFASEWVVACLASIGRAGGRDRDR